VKSTGLSEDGDGMMETALSFLRMDRDGLDGRQCHLAVCCSLEIPGNPQQISIHVKFRVVNQVESYKAPNLHTLRTAIQAFQ